MFGSKIYIKALYGLNMLWANKYFYTIIFHGWYFINNTDEYTNKIIIVCFLKLSTTLSNNNNYIKVENKYYVCTLDMLQYIIHNFIQRRIVYNFSLKI